MSRRSSCNNCCCRNNCCYRSNCGGGFGGGCGGGCGFGGGYGGGCGFGFPLLWLFLLGGCW